GAECLRRAVPRYPCGGRTAAARCCFLARLPGAEQRPSLGGVQAADHRDTADPETTARAAGARLAVLAAWPTGGCRRVLRPGIHGFIRCGPATAQPPRPRLSVADRAV